MSLIAGTLSLVSVTTTSVSLIATAATGGTGLVTYQWYRSTTAGFTPGPSNILIGDTSLTLVDTDLTSNTQYYYVLAATDTTPTTVLYAQTPAMTLTTLRIGYMGAIGNQYAQARQAGYDLIAVANLASLMSQMATAASHGQRKFTISFTATYQPADLRGNTSCHQQRRAGSGSCGCGGGCGGGCNNQGDGRSIYALPIGNSLSSNGYIGNGCGQGYGPLWPAYQSGIYSALFSQDIMENEVTVSLNLNDLVTTSVNLNFTF